MKKSFLAQVSLVVVVALSASMPQSYSAVKSGDSCKKIGSTATSGGKKYTCIKSGKKLVWNKGVAIAAPKPSPVATPTSSPTPTPSASPTPTTTPIVEKAPTAFADLVENYRGIPDVVWRESQSLAERGIAQSNFVIEMGPNTKLQEGLDNPSVYLERASRLWSGFNQAKTTKVFIFNKQDLVWAQQKNLALGGSWFKPEDLAGNCSSASSCGAFGGAYRGVGQIFMGVPIRDYLPFNLGIVEFRKGPGLGPES